MLETILYKTSDWCSESQAEVHGIYKGKKRAQGAATESQDRIRRRSWTRKMPRNMELTGLLLRNTDVVGGHNVIQYSGYTSKAAGAWQPKTSCLWQLAWHPV
jgi:hypothetical protein